jgi:hypothetical protein
MPPDNLQIEAIKCFFNKEGGGLTATAASLSLERRNQFNLVTNIIALVESDQDQ